MSKKTVPVTIHGLDGMKVVGRAEVDLETGTAEMQLSPEYSAIMRRGIGDNLREMIISGFSASPVDPEVAQQAHHELYEFLKDE